eukprot:gene6367-7020_t
MLVSKTSRRLGTKAVLCTRLSSGANPSPSQRRLAPPPGFRPPEPKPLRIADGNYSGFASGALSALARLGTGVFVVGWTPISSKPGPWPGTLGFLRDGSTVLDKYPKPNEPIILYEYEASPYCRKVREACSLLDLPLQCRPCPGARTGWSDHLAGLTGGKRTVPFIIDGEVQMHESDDIIAYLFRTYGPGESKIPWTLKKDFAVWSSVYASALRSNEGSRLLPSVRPDIDTMEPVVLWGYEGSPFVKPVRETLSSLGLAYIYVPCARGSANRDKLYELTGRFQVPFLQDPNTGVEMFESAEIVRYLLDVYTIPLEQQDMGGGAKVEGKDADKQQEPCGDSLIA